MNNIPEEPSPKTPFLTRTRLKLKAFFTSDEEQEWHDIIAGEQEDGEILTDHEKSLISAALQMDTMDAEQVSLPRSEIIFIHQNDKLPKIIKTFQNARKTRLAVVGKNLDNVIGFVSIKDIIGSIGNEKAFSLAEITRPATFVPEGMGIDKVLQYMKKNRVSLAIVVDEYGGTAGLITIKDILEELVGDFEDDDETIAIEAPKQITQNTYKIDPKMEIEDFRKFFSLPEPKIEEDFETIGGLVLSIAGKVPPTGTVVKISTTMQAKITATDGRRILELEITR